MARQGQRQHDWLSDSRFKRPRRPADGPPADDPHRLPQGRSEPPGIAGVKKSSGGIPRDALQILQPQFPVVAARLQIEADDVDADLVGLVAADMSRAHSTALRTVVGTAIATLGIAAGIWLTEALGLAVGVVYLLAIAALVTPSAIAIARTYAAAAAAGRDRLDTISP